MKLGCCNWNLIIWLPSPTEAAIRTIAEGFKGFKKCVRAQEDAKALLCSRNTRDRPGIST